MHAVPTNQIASVCILTRKGFIWVVLDHVITLKIFDFILNSKEKLKPGFYFPQCVCFLNRTGPNPNLTAFISKI